MNVLVTGASSGFGRAIAQEFGGKGHKVIALARRKEQLESLAQEIPHCILCLVIFATKILCVKP